MEKFGSLLKRCIKDVQPCVEDIVGLDLGEVQTLPLTEYWNQIVKRSNHIIPLIYTKRELRFSLWSREFMLHPLSKAENSTVYYSQSPLSSFFPGIFVPNVAAHELAHLAHYKIINRDSLKATDASEEFADYVAGLTCNKLGKPVASFSRKHAIRFHELLAKEGLPDTIDGAVSYLRSENKRNEERSKVYDTF